ncbi:hypothetical protein SAMN05421842_11792 [Clostridium uliginosum]|uniref:Uncharacterized protein n=1 Tax=Clostridium uliginosum TaxID=119641 RepID=A0A1I1PC45_9CLOT|nr:hypothetical protein SAMN05421842_11792 [Clostridium uliginosum]
MKFVSACETENAMEERSGFVTESIVNDLFNKIIIEELI